MVRTKNPWGVRLGECLACVELGLHVPAVTNCVRHAFMCQYHYERNCRGRSHNYPMPNDRINKSRPYRPRTA